MLANIPTILLSYAFQSAFFPAFESLSNKTDKKGLLASGLSMGFCFVIYMSISIISVLAFGTEIKSDVLLNLGVYSDFLTIILMIMFMIIAAMHIPIVFFVGKDSLLIIIDELVRRSTSESKCRLQSNIDNAITRSMAGANSALLTGSMAAKDRDIHTS